MTEEKTEDSNQGFARIEPASISLTATSSQAVPVNKFASLKQSPLVWLGLGALLTSALVVIFLLPRWVDKPGVEPSAQTPVATTTPVASNKPTAGDRISPWEKAQEASLRKETQDILSQMLEAQKALAERGVEHWAGEDYAQAMQYARAGDERYNDRDFVQSRTEYEKALTIFSRLVEEMDVIFKATMEKGKQALEDGDSAAAIKAFDLALSIDAIDRAAITGRERAAKIDEVLELMDQGEQLLGKGQLQEARQFFQQALALDEHFSLAQKQIEVTDEKILDDRFNQHMSTGFSAMERKQFGQAQKAFDQALKLKPRSAEARAALEQTGHKLTTININSLLNKAKELESQEQWHEALKNYQAALKLDSSLAEAQKGEQATTLRSKLHDRLESILSQPMRLYDGKVYRETVDFQGKLKALSNPGPVLSKQLAALAKIIQKADTPVEITLQSDMQTQVTLRRIGELGLFERKTLSVKPGKYVAVGIRNGYRDVRVEFLVDPDKPPGTILVQAQEKIALGR